MDYFNEEPIVIRNVEIPKGEGIKNLGMPLTIAGIAGIVASVFLPYVTTRPGANGARSSVFTSWDVCEVSQIGFLNKYLFLVFCLLAVAGIWKQYGSLLIACCVYWVINFVFCVTNARESEVLFAGSHPEIMENDSIFRYSMGLGFYVYIVAVVVFVAGTVLFCKEAEE
ncbi:MAG: hypothetical protein K6B39_00415 [Lachnospiraceae bacterium]|nr:hypothetical protein [Lachnospiraceae bacterium]MCR5085834.1 hypothetical protein [Lachnospiraceae bacterium]